MGWKRASGMNESAARWRAELKPPYFVFTCLLILCCQAHVCVKQSETTLAQGLTTDCPCFIRQKRKHLQFASLQFASLRFAPSLPGWAEAGQPIYRGERFSVIIFKLYEKKLSEWNPEDDNIHSSFIPLMRQFLRQARPPSWAWGESLIFFLAGCFFSMETGAVVDRDLVNGVTGWAQCWFASSVLCVRHNTDGLVRVRKGRLKEERWVGKKRRRD